MLCQKQHILDDFTVSFRTVSSSEALAKDDLPVSAVLKLGLVGSQTSRHPKHWRRMTNAL
jgi:hypothetical protein